MITPYTTPVQFEYKPLNLAAFAVPLGKMQEQFDLTKAAVSSTDFDLSHLPFGTDPQKAKELIATAREKRDALAKNLLETKNYKQAAIKLMELNKAWKLDPEKGALEANAALWKKRDEEERARIDNGKDNQITRDQYLQWRADEIAKYEEAGGAGFKASYEKPEGEYKKITGDTGRLSDLEDELQKLSFQVGQAVQGDKRESALRMIGIDPTTLDARFQKSIVEELDGEKVSKAVREYLLNQPKYQAWAKEVAHYDHLDMVRSGKYGDYASQIVDRALASNENAIKQRELALKKSKGKKEEDDIYNNLLEKKAALNEMKTTGEYDPNIVEGLYTNQRLQETFDFTKLGNVFEYRKTTTEDVFRDIDDGSGSGSKKTGLGDEAFFSPETDVKYDLGNFQTQVKNAYGKIIEPLKKMNNFANGNVRAAIFDGLSEEEKKNLRGNFGAQVARNRALFTAFENSKSVSDFINNAKANGITLSKGRAYTLFDAWNAQDGTGRKQFMQTLEGVRAAEEEYNSSKENLSTIKKQIYKTDTWKTEVDNLGKQTGFLDIRNYDIDPLQGYEATKEASQRREKALKQNALFDRKNYSAEQLKKAGISVVYRDGKVVNQPLTFDQVAKLKGYKNAKDALERGYDFNNAWITDKNGRTLRDISQWKSQTENKIAPNLNTNEMSFNLLNTPQISKDLSQMVTTAAELIQHQPAYKNSWNNMPGFTEDGKIKEGTKLLTGDVYKPVVQVNNNQLYYKYYYEYIDDEGVTQKGSVAVKPKKGLDPKNLQLLDDMLYTASTGRDTEVNNNTKDMLLNTKFDVVYPNSLNQSTYDGIIAKRGQKVFLESIPLPGQNQSLVFKKEFPEGAMEPIIKLYHRDGANNNRETAIDVTGTPGGTGQIFTTSDPAEAKRFAASLLVDVEKR